MTTPSAEVDRAFRALADPSRRDFVSRLADRPMSVSELAEHTDLTLAAVVQHVQLLQASGLVTTRKSGRVRMCELRAEGLTGVEEWLSARRLLWESRLDALGDVLEDRRP
jgi:DNA-binding transcriptional ArsR family regulator